MPPRKNSRKPSGVSRKGSAIDSPRGGSHGVTGPAKALAPAEESSPVTLRTPAFLDAVEDIEETLNEIDEAALRAPRRTSLPSPRRDAG